MRRLFLVMFVACFLSACSAEISSGRKSEDSASTNNNSNNVSSVGDNVNQQSPGSEVNNINEGDADDNGGSPFCEEVMTNDGPEGFLWKPISEGDGNLVILFPEEFRREFLSVRVEVAPEEGSEEDPVTEECRFDGYFEDGRLVYRCSMPGGFYTGRVEADDRSQECVWEIEGEPSERND